jgi:hypothetical protein
MVRIVNLVPNFLSAVSVADCSSHLLLFLSAVSVAD